VTEPMKNSAIALCEDMQAVSAQLTCLHLSGASRLCQRTCGHLHIFRVLIVLMGVRVQAARQGRGRRDGRHTFSCLLSTTAHADSIFARLLMTCRSRRLAQRASVQPQGHWMHKYLLHSMAHKCGMRKGGAHLPDCIGVRAKMADLDLALHAPGDLGHQVLVDEALRFFYLPTQRPRINRGYQALALMS